MVVAISFKWRNMLQRLQ